MRFDKNREERQVRQGDAYRALKPILQQFVDAYLAGEKATHVVARLRPKLKRPQELASRWLARADAKAAIAEGRSPPERLATAVEAIERHLAGIEKALRATAGQRRGRR